VAELSKGRFRPVLDDPRALKPDRVRRLVLCSGKVWVDVEAALAGGAHRPEGDPALVRVEELYPFPDDGLRAILARYRRLKEVVWLQEEPRNMGGWAFVAPRLRELIGERELRYLGRPEMASPAEGWGHAHAGEQRRIVEAVFEGVASHAG